MNIIGFGLGVQPAWDCNWGQVGVHIHAYPWTLPLRWDVTPSQLELHPTYASNWCPYQQPLMFNNQDKHSFSLFYWDFIGSSGDLMGFD